MLMPARLVYEVLAGIETSPVGEELTGVVLQATFELQRAELVRAHGDDPAGVPAAQREPRGRDPREPDVAGVDRRVGSSCPTVDTFHVDPSCCTAISRPR